MNTRFKIYYSSSTVNGQMDLNSIRINRSTKCIVIISSQIVGILLLECVRDAIPAVPECWARHVTMVIICNSEQFGVKWIFILDSYTLMYICS